MAIEPDTKDWTWVLERPCPDCGFDPARVEPAALPELIHLNTQGWYGALDGPGAAERPAPDRWSRLEYACHVRDVHRLFSSRVAVMLKRDDPVFPNWDQDQTAIELRYAEQDPAAVEVALIESAAEVAAVYAGVRGEQWQRPGRRDNGSVFTVATLGAYHLHDAVHHLWDIAGDRPGARAEPGEAAE